MHALVHILLLILLKPCLIFRYLNNRNRRPDDLQGFITLEEFMLSQQEDQRHMIRNRPVSPRITPLTSDHVHVQHRNFHDNEAVNEQSRTMIDTGIGNDVHARSRTNDEGVNNTSLYGYSRNMETFHVPRQSGGDFDLDRNEHRGSSKYSAHKKSNDFCYVGKKKSVDSINSQQIRVCNSPHCKIVANEQKPLTTFCHNKPDTVDKPERQTSTPCEYNISAYASQAQSSSNHEVPRPYDYYLPRNMSSLTEDSKAIPRRLVRNDGNICSFYDNFEVHTVKFI